MERREVQFQPLLTLRIVTRKTQAHGINQTGTSKKILVKKKQTNIPNRSGSTTEDGKSTWNKKKKHTMN
eukprot:9146784-Prorocentrum_lima.AAC.1